MGTATPAATSTAVSERRQSNLINVSLSMEIGATGQTSVLGAPKRARPPLRLCPKVERRWGHSLDTVCRKRITFTRCPAHDGVAIRFECTQATLHSIDIPQQRGSGRSKRNCNNLSPFARYGHGSKTNWRLGNRDNKSVLVVLTGFGA